MGTDALEHLRFFMFFRAVSARRVLAGTCAATVAAALAAAAVPAPSQANTPNRINDLAGRWAGAGTVRWKNGREQPYKCTVTYFLGDNGARARLSGSETVASNGVVQPVDGLLMRAAAAAAN